MKWEYLVVPMVNFTATWGGWVFNPEPAMSLPSSEQGRYCDLFQKELNKYGEEGWEFVGLTGVSSGVMFKRPESATSCNCGRVSYSHEPGAVAGCGALDHTGLQLKGRP